MAWTITGVCTRCADLLCKINFVIFTHVYYLKKYILVFWCFSDPVRTLKKMEPQPAGCWRADILSQLKQRNRSEVAPFQALLLLQSRLMEQSAHLQTENAALSRLNQSLKEEKVQLEAALQARAAVNQVADSHTIHELQMKMFNLQEELTELHRCGDGFRVVSVAFFLQCCGSGPSWVWASRIR
jgi:hypothetical protein